MSSRRYLVCYDICEPRRLRQVAKVLQGYGVRLQYSVFECRLSGVQLAEVRRELATILEVGEDQVLFVSLIDRDTNNQDLVISSLGLPYTQRSVVTII